MCWKENLLKHQKVSKYYDQDCTKELKYAEKRWVYNNQRKIITSLKFNQLKKSLGKFYDMENILWVKGWFSNADVDYTLNI